MKLLKMSLLFIFFTSLSFTSFAEGESLDELRSQYLGEEVNSGQIVSLDEVKVVATDRYKATLKSVDFGLVEVNRMVAKEAFGLVLKNVYVSDLVSEEPISIGDVLIFPLPSLTNGVGAAQMLARDILRAANTPEGEFTYDSEFHKGGFILLSSFNFGSQLTSVSEILGRGDNENKVRLGNINIYFQAYAGDDVSYKHRFNPFKETQEIRSPISNILKIRVGYEGWVYNYIPEASAGVVCNEILKQRVAGTDKE